MTDWFKKYFSDIPITNRLEVSFSLDTNVLVYHFSGIYPNVDKLIGFLRENDFFRMKISPYILFELQEVLKNILCYQIIDNKTNEELFSCDQRKNKYPEDKLIKKYADYRQKITDKINRFIERITDEEVEILADDSSFNANLENSMELCLATPLSRKDSLVLYLYRDEYFIVSNDRQFIETINNPMWKDRIEEVFKELSPEDTSDDTALKRLIPLQTFTSASGSSINLLHKNNIADNTLMEKIRELFLSKNRDSFFGTTLPGIKDKKLICFKLKEDKKMEKINQVAIVGKNLDFILPPLLNPKFWCNDEPIITNDVILNSGKQISLSLEKYLKNLYNNFFGNTKEVIEEFEESVFARGNMIFLLRD